jgi:hypothetical protein
LNYIDTDNRADLMDADPVAAQDTDQVGNLGPCMLALTVRQRAFVMALYELPATRGSLSAAAARAGYSAKNKKSLNQMAHALWNSDKIRAAFQETGYRYIGHTAVAAIKAAKELIYQPEHPDHLKACRMFIDRGWPTESYQRVDVSHQHHHQVWTPDPLIMQALADQLGIPVNRLWGASRVEPKLIESAPAEAATVITDDDGDEDGVE